MQRFTVKMEGRDFLVVLIRGMNAKAALLSVIQIPAFSHCESFSELFLI